jgi:hypothetical protein
MDYDYDNVGDGYTGAVPGGLASRWQAKALLLRLSVAMTYYEFLI